MLDKAHLALSHKKCDQLTIDIKKFTAKDKNSVIKILEDIKLNNWIINQDVMAKLINLSIGQVGKRETIK